MLIVKQQNSNRSRTVELYGRVFVLRDLKNLAIIYNILCYKIYKLQSSQVAYRQRPVITLLSTNIIYHI